MPGRYIVLEFRGIMDIIYIFKVFIFNNDKVYFLNKEFTELID